MLMMRMAQQVEVVGLVAGFVVFDLVEVKLNVFEVLDLAVAVVFEVLVPEG